MVIRAITFDFWNTLYADEGHAFRALTRRRLDHLARALAGVGANPSNSELYEAYKDGFAMYLAAWRSNVISAPTSTCPTSSTVSAHIQTTAPWIVSPVA